MYLGTYAQTSKLGVRARSCGKAEFEPNMGGETDTQRCVCTESDCRNCCEAAQISRGAHMKELTRGRTQFHCGMSWWEAAKLAFTTMSTI